MIMAARLWGCANGWCGSVAWTYLNESANKFSCIVKRFVAFGPVWLGGLEGWEPELGAEMACLSGNLMLTFEIKLKSRPVKKSTLLYLL